MGCEFHIRSSVIALQRDFRQGVDEGINQTGRLITDIRTRIQEKIKPGIAYFLTPIESRTNLLTEKEDLYWQGYKRSIDESMRRNIALLRVRSESEARINQAVTVRKTWQMIRDRGLSLVEGEGVQFMALRTTNPADGVAVQQLSRKDGQLILESNLLPFDQIDQIDNFRGLLGQRGEDISLESIEGDVDPAVTWAVQGPALDFKEDLPGLIEQVNPPLVLPEALPAMTPMVNPDQFRQVPEVIPITAMPEIQSDEPVLAIEEQLERQRLEPEKPLSVAAVPKIVEMPAPVFVANEVPTRLDLEVPLEVPRKQNQQLEAETVFQATSILSRPMPISVLPEIELEPEAPVFVVSSGSGSEMPTRLDLEGLHTEAVQEPTRLKQKSEEIASQHPTDTIIPFRNGIKPKILEEPEIATVVFESVTQQKKSTREIQVARGGKGKVEKAIPIYQLHWQPLAIRDIPEWVWQGTAAIPDEIIDWSWFLVTMFYALLNTKVLLKERVNENFSLNQGSGFSFLEEKTN